MLYVNALYILLELQHLASGCPFALAVLLYGHLPYHAPASTPHARPLLCGDVLAWTPVPCARHLSLWTLLTLLGLKHPYWALLQWECLPLSLELSHPALGYLQC